MNWLKKVRSSGKWHWKPDFFFLRDGVFFKKNFQNTVKRYNIF